MVSSRLEGVHGAARVPFRVQSSLYLSLSTEIDDERERSSFCSRGGRILVPFVLVGRREES